LQRPQFELKALSEVLPTSLIADCLLEADRKDQRSNGKLPMALLPWLLIGMGLFRDLNIAQVLARVVEATGDLVRWGHAELPHATSLAKARDRLGWEVLRAIFRKFAALLTEQHSAPLLWRGLSVFTLDGTTFRTPDTPANEAWFGRPGTSRGGTSAYPHMRAAMLMGAWTHVVAEVVLGPYHLSELKLAEHMLERLKPGMLLLLDRAFHTFVWPARFFERRVDFVMRAKSGRCVATPKKQRRLGPGDWLCVLQANAYTRRRWPGFEDVQVRMITRRRRGFRSVSILTSLLSANDYPAQEVFDLYADRWEAELGYRELKVHLVDEPVPFRSHRPDRVLQEIYGLLIAYNAVRALMCRGAEVAGVGPTRLSFTDCLEHVRVALMMRMTENDLVDAISRRRLPPRRKERSCPRAVKIKFSKWPRKRSGQAPAKTRRQHQRARYAERQARLASVS
jgi:Insertion element 4 transposase N-terminal/Transposase DDE domain